MIELRHVGIYVENMEQMVSFYENTFDMKKICYNQPDSNSLIDELMGVKGIEIIATKLITPRGQQCGTGDMVELIKIINNKLGKNVTGSVYNIGIVHMSIGVDDIENICEKVICNGGKQFTKICKHENGNKFAFVNDPEGNWIELIQRKNN